MSDFVYNFIKFSFLLVSRSSEYVVVEGELIGLIDEDLSGVVSLAVGQEAQLDVAVSGGDVVQANIDHRGDVAVAGVNGVAGSSSVHQADINDGGSSIHTSAAPPHVTLVVRTALSMSTL